MSRRVSNIDGPHPVDVHVGLRLRMRRAQVGMSQPILGEKLGITFQQIQKYERGANRVSASMLYEIATALQTEIAYFFEDMPETSDPSASSTPPSKQQQKSLSISEERRLIDTMSRLPSSVRGRIISLALAVKQSTAENKADSTAADNY